MCCVSASAALAVLVMCTSVSVAAGNATTTPCNTTATACPATSVSIECCELWSTLNAYIRTHSGIDRSECTPASCLGTGQIQRFLEETNAVLSQKTFVSGSRIVVPRATPAEMQRVLVWAFLGRHFTSMRQETQQDDFFFEFNISTRTMALRKIQCEFQKPVYVSMIVLTIIVLLFIIASRIMAQSQPKPAPPPAEHAKTSHTDMSMSGAFPAGMPTHFVPSVALRYRYAPLASTDV